MKLCWNFDPEQRPSFAMCLQRLEELADESKYHKAPLMVHNAVHNQSYSRNYILSRKSCSFLYIIFV